MFSTVRFVPVTSVFLLIAVSLLSTTEGFAQAPGQQAQQSAEVAQPVSLTSPTLASSVKEYRQSPDTATWDRVWATMREFLGDPRLAKESATALIKANPCLTDLRVKVVDAGGARIFAFPSVSESQAIFLQWVHSQPAKPGLAAFTQVRVQVVPIPSSVALADAHIVRTVAFKEVRKKKVKIEGPKNLILAGNDKTTGLLWLKSFRLADSNWVETFDVLSGIPPYLLQNVGGKASFWGNDLILTIAGSKPQGTQISATDGGSKSAPSSGYRIALKLVDGKYTLDGQKANDIPLSVVLQFSQALALGRVDLAKAWLADPRLISIPKYVGLLGRSSPTKLVAMTLPPGGGVRYRMVTFGKNDLIIDVGKVKQQWAIKALFIAPPDPLAQKLSGVSAGTIETSATPTETH